MYITQEKARGMFCPMDRGNETLWKRIRFFFRWNKTVAGCMHVRCMWWQRQPRAEDTGVCKGRCGLIVMQKVGE